MLKSKRFDLPPRNLWKERGGGWLFHPGGRREASARAFTRQNEEEERERERGAAAGRASEDVSDSPAGGVAAFTRKYQRKDAQMRSLLV